MAEAIFNDAPILAVTPDIIHDLKLRASESPLRRYRLCMHYDTSSPTQEMVIVACGDSYMPPHRHPAGKSESYHIIEGSMTVFFFNDGGEVIQKIEMGESGSGKPSLYRMSEAIWHMPMPTSKWLVYHETYTGPFDVNVDIESPAWLPNQNDPVSVRCFVERVMAG